MMRAVSHVMMASMLFSTTLPATAGIQGIAAPQPVAAMATQASVDWLASTSLPALPGVNTGGGGSVLHLDADLVANDGQVGIQV